MKKTASKADEDMKPHYDFSNAVVGKHHKAFAARTNLVLLEPDVADFFPDSESVNAALRQIIVVAKRARAAQA